MNCMNYLGTYLKTNNKKKKMYSIFIIQMSIEFKLHDVLFISDAHHKELQSCSNLSKVNPPTSASSLYSDQVLQHQLELDSAARSEELGAVSEAVLNIEQELSNVANKLNSITSLYKKSQCDRIGIPTLGLILVWPVLTQFVFMWYASRNRGIQQSR